MSSEVLNIRDICKTVSADLKSRRITQKQVAEMVGTTKQTIANQLSGKKRFSDNMAQKFSDFLGYNPNFLLYGFGPLHLPGRLECHPNPAPTPLLFAAIDDNMIQESLNCRTAAHILEIINDKLAIECFQKAISGNHEESNKLMALLESRYCYNIPLLTKDPKITLAFRQMRNNFRHFEILSAKKLVIIEQKAALGELIDVDAEVERFRERLLWIKDSFKEDAIQKNPEISIDNYLSDDEKEALKSFFNSKI